MLRRRGHPTSVAALSATQSIDLRCGELMVPLDIPVRDARGSYFASRTRSFDAVHAVYLRFREKEMG
jgi:hypothetical protein